MGGRARGWEIGVERKVTVLRDIREHFFGENTILRERNLSRCIKSVIDGRSTRCPGSVLNYCDIISLLFMHFTFCTYSTSI